MTKKSERLLLEALPSIQRTARRLAAVYRSPRFDTEELTQIGALAVCEALKRGIHPTSDKIGYVVVIARRAMQRHCGVYRSLIKTPRTRNGYQPALVVLSLDMPLFADDEVTLLDRLAGEAVEAAEDYAAAYDAYLDGLPGEGARA
jgi:hypothetical protein